MAFCDRFEPAFVLVLFLDRGLAVDELRAARFFDLVTEGDTEAVDGEGAAGGSPFLYRDSFGGPAWFLVGSTPVLTYQLLSNAKTSPCMLTANDQFRHVLSPRHRGVVWLDLQDVEGVGPVHQVYLGIGVW